MQTDVNSLHPTPVTEQISAPQKDNKEALLQSHAVNNLTTEATASLKNVDPLIVPASQKPLVKEEKEGTGENLESRPKENKNSNELNRRSRRSPRHLRINNQRRRNESCPMPLSQACASPEIALGKVWVNYPSTTTIKPASTIAIDPNLQQDISSNKAHTFEKPDSKIISQEPEASRQQIASAPATKAAALLDIDVPHKTLIETSWQRPLLECFWRTAAGGHTATEYATSPNKKTS